MFIPLLPPKGTSLKIATFKGPPGSIVVNTDVNTIHVYDGQTFGGFPLSKVGHQHTFNEITSFLGFAPAQLGFDGKLLVSQLPKIAVTDTFVVGSLAEMLALTAETGDMAVRTDLKETFILKGTDATDESDWQEFLSPSSDVTSVNGQRGVVILTSTDLSEGTNKYFTDQRARSALSLVAGACGAVYDASSGVLNLSAVVAPPGGDNNQIQYNKNGVFGGSTGLTFDASTGVVSATGFSGSGAALTALNATSLTGVVALARLGTGTPSLTTYLRGDGAWQPLSLSSSQIVAGLGYTPVGTINSKTGANITLTTSDVSEGASLYFTSARARSALSLVAGSSGATYSSASGVLDLSALLTTSGNGSGLSNLNAANLTTGTVSPARLGSGAPDATTFLRGDNTWAATGTVTSVTVSAANGVSATVATQGTTPALTFTLGDITPSSVAATGALSGTTFSGTTAAFSGAVNAASFTGSGAALTALNASQLATGTVGIARLGNTGTAGVTTYLRGDNSWATAVSAVTVATANGVSGTVANQSTTPIITLVLGAITPTSVASTGAISGTTGSFSGALSATGGVTGSLAGNASTATALQTGRVISASGDATGASAAFDGTAAAVIALTLATVNLSPVAASLSKVTTNGKGLVTATTAVTTADLTPLLDTTYALKAGDTFTGPVTAPSFVGPLTGNASTATTAAALTTARTIAITGDATWSTSFSGAANVTAALTLATVNTAPVTNGLAKVTTNGKGLVTATTPVVAADITSLVSSTYALKAGDTFTGPVIAPSFSAGTTLASVTSGDLCANRGGTGIVFLGKTNAYVYFDGTGYTMPNYGLTVGGDVVGTSDARVKSDIEVISDALNKLQKVNGVTFRRTDGEDPNNPTRYAGVIAQDVEKVLPESVTETRPKEDGTGGGVKGVSHAGVVGLLVEAVKELRVEVLSLRAQMVAAQLAKE